ncbi:hypothetical protein EV426DRAFT_579166 [Tirmania nivea]|nr:hypothetical protein EV426DRAFT_579166 [Tirmania nivea]
MAPIGQINYLTNKSVSQAVNILAQDITKKGVKGKQEYNRDEDKDEGKEADAEEPRKILRGPKHIVGVMNIEENDNEEEEEEAPKNIKTRSGTESVERGTGMVRPQGTRTSKKVVNIEEDKEDEEDEEEEVLKNIKTKSGKVKVWGGKGNKVVDDEEEEEAPTYTYTKTKSETGSVGAGKGIVRPKGIQTSKKVMNIEDDNEEEEKAPTYTYTKTKSGTGSVRVVNTEDDDEEEEEALKKNKTRTRNVMNFEVDNKEEEEEEEEEDEVPTYIKTKSRKEYIEGAKGIVGGSG